MGIKQSLKKIIGQGNLGRLDFIRYPSARDSWGGPFNGQQCRQQIFFDLLGQFSFEAIVETGTYRGTTTAAFAATSLPVYTVESHPRFFAYSKLRFLGKRRKVHVYNCDSRNFLKELSRDPSVPKTEVFFYLDAHWEEDLPLREELEIIFSRWIRPIVMIDDFQVPRSDYGFDDYGPGKTLNLPYISSVVTAHEISVYFPKASSSEETGSKRGSVVLCKETTCVAIDRQVNTLVRYL